MSVSTSRRRRPAPPQVARGRAPAPPLAMVEVRAPLVLGMTALAMRSPEIMGCIVAPLLVGGLLVYRGLVECRERLVAERGGKDGRLLL